MPIAVKGTGGGSVTLSAGAAVADTTLTLPNVSGTVINTAPGAAGQVLTSTGTAWQSATPSGGGQIQYALFTASGTWTAPTNVTKAFVYCVGAGGGSVVNTYGGCGPIGWYGGAGGFAIALVTVVPGTGYTITIGTAGAGTVGTSAGVITGTSGGTSSLGSLVTSTGGGAGGISGSGGSVNPTNGTGSTTGTMIRSGAQGSPLNNSNGAQVLGIFSGRQSVGPNGSSAATVWALDAQYGPGVSGNPVGLSAYGGVNGAILIQYVG